MPEKFQIRETCGRHDHMAAVYTQLDGGRTIQIATVEIGCDAIECSEFNRDVNIIRMNGNTLYATRYTHSIRNFTMYSHAAERGDEVFCVYTNWNYDRDHENEFICIGNEMMKRSGSWWIEKGDEYYILEYENRKDIRGMRRQNLSLFDCSGVKTREGLRYHRIADISQVTASMAENIFEGEVYRRFTIDEFMLLVSLPFL